MDNESAYLRRHEKPRKLAHEKGPLPFGLANQDKCSPYRAGALTRGAQPRDITGHSKTGNSKFSSLGRPIAKWAQIKRRIIDSNSCGNVYISMALGSDHKSCVALEKYRFFSRRHVFRRPRFESRHFPAGQPPNHNVELVLTIIKMTIIK